MGKLVTNFYSLLNRDVCCESESNNLTVLLRIQTLVDFAYSIALAIVFFVCFSTKVGCMALAFGLLHILVLYMTYKCNSRVSLFTYCMLVSVSTVYYCQWVSPGLGFRFVIFVIIPLIYFKTDESWTFRICWSTLCAAFSGTLAILGLYVSVSWIIPAAVKIILIALTTLTFASKLMVISHFYYKKFATDELKIIKYSQKLEILATQDPLTKLQNRRGMENYLKNKIDNPQGMLGFSVAIADIDFFKKINDTYGHECGDYVLTAVSGIMAEFMQSRGKIARWGGEEFLLIFDDNGDNAFIEAENLRRRIELAELNYEGHPIKVTMTFGLEEYSPLYKLEESIEMADKKLYIGKTSGRNKVVY